VNSGLQFTLQSVSAIWAPLLILTLFSSGVALVLGRRRWTHSFLVLTGLVSLGTVVGFVTGLSRVGAVGPLVSGVISLLAPLAIYLFKQDSSHGSIVGASIAIFSLSMFIGVANGSGYRRDAEIETAFVDFCIDRIVELDSTSSAQEKHAFATAFGERCSYVVAKYLNRAIPPPSEEADEAFYINYDRIQAAIFEGDEARGE